MTMLTASSRMREVAITLTIAVLLAGIAAISFGQQERDEDGNENENVRVVIQDPALVPIQLRLEDVIDERDGFIIVKPRRHIAEFHRSDKPQLLKAFIFPSNLTGAAIGPNAEWIMFSYERGLIKHDLMTGEERLLSEGTDGLLALDASGEKLAVFGKIESDDPRRTYAGTLGIWDVNKENWIARERTPIIAPSSSRPVLVWDGNNPHFSQAFEISRIWCDLGARLVID